MKFTVTHKTVVVKKKLSFPPNKVFNAFANVTARTQWAVPKGDAIKYLKSNFKVGGQETFKCGDPSSMSFSGVVHYEDIVKNHRIVSTESISHNNKRLSSALTTLLLDKDINGTQLVLTAQIVSYDGSDMAIGYKQGWKAVLKNLGEYLKSN
jgi:uncharacterized protein YndB with AHSA1/START domain